MALLSCPDCGQQVSSRAAACPHCGAPVGAQPTTIQQSSKELKAWTAVGAVIFLVGLAWLLFIYVQQDKLYPTASSFREATLWPAGITLTGLLWTIIIRVRTWWHHG